MKLLLAEHPALRQPAQDVDPASIPAKVIHKMKWILSISKGVGLAANQVGLDHNLFIFRNNGPFEAIFNPHLCFVSDELALDMEGCLSVPDQWFPIPRANKVTLEGLNYKGEYVRYDAEGHLARVFQHETDHLSGKLVTDYV